MMMMIALLIALVVVLIGQAALIAHHLGDLKAYTMTMISLLQQQVPPPPGTDWTDPFEYENVRKFLPGWRYYGA